MNNNFTLEFDEFDDLQQNKSQKKQQMKNNSDQKKNSVQNKSQMLFQAKTITKGFLSQENQSYTELMSEDSSPTRLNSKKQGNQHQQHIKSRRKKKIDKLQPYKQTQQVQVFKNFQETNALYSKRKQKNSKSKDQKDISQKLSVDKQKKVKDHQSKVQKQSKSKSKHNKTRKTFQYQQKNGSHKNSQQLFNQYKSQEEKQQKINIDPLIDQIPQKQTVNKEGETSPQIKKNVVFQAAQQDDEDSPNKLIQHQDMLSHVIKIVSNPLKPNTVMKMTLQRDSSGFNTFWPVFHLKFMEDNSYLISAKKTSSKPSSTFIMAASKSNFQQDSKCYLGKVKSNFIGDTLMILGPGLNPNNAFQLKKRPRQVLATVVYQTSYFQGGKPRDFKVYVKKQKVDYYKDFPEVKLYEDEIPLNLLYQEQRNRNKIMVLKNRSPEYRQQIKGYMLNFRGRVTKPSIKNFILQDEQHPGVDLMIFGKIGNDIFSLDVYHPLSPCIGFGIALSSFDSRILIE